MEAIDRKVEQVQMADNTIVFRALMDERDYVTLVFRYKYAPLSNMEKLLRPTMTLIDVDMRHNGAIQFIKPPNFAKAWDSNAQHLWTRQMERLEHCYMTLIEKGFSVQDAKTVLPAAVCHTVEFSGERYNWEILCHGLSNECERVRRFFKPICQQLGFEDKGEK